MKPSDRKPWKPSHVLEREAPSPTIVRTPFDPVLRQALIDRGIITPQDLVDAQAKINAVSDLINGS